MPAFITPRGGYSFITFSRRRSAIESASSRADDEAALQDMFTSLDGANWDTQKTYPDGGEMGTNNTATGTNTGWGASGMSLDNNIYGVTVASRNGELRVTEINLERNGLEGTMPQTIENFTEIEVFRVKKNLISGNIPDAFAGWTKCWYLSLAGRTLDDEWTDPLTDYNSKHGIATNQYTGGMPPSIYQLSAANMMEMDGLSGQFEGTLDPACGNWPIVRIFMGGNIFHDAEGNTPAGYTEGSSFTGEIPSEISSWVNCESMQMQDTDWSGIGVNPFQGWNDIRRHIELGADGNAFQPTWTPWNQSWPDMSHLTQIESVSFLNRGLTGEFPDYLFAFTNFNALTVSGHEFTYSQNTFPSLTNFGDQAFRFIISDCFADGVSVKMFSDGENVAGYFNNRMILFQPHRDDALTGQLPEGMDTWGNLRVCYLNAANYNGPLPNDPPGLHSPSLTRWQLNGNGLTGGIPTTWGEAGTNEVYGGSTASYTVADWGDNGDGTFWIDIQEGGMTTNEHVGEANQIGFLINHPASSFEGRRKILSNTATRINYEGYDVNGNMIGVNNLEVGNTLDIVWNYNDDIRDFEYFNLSSNSLDAPLDAAAIPTTLVSGGDGLRVHNNNLVFSHLIPFVGDIEARIAAMPVGDQYTFTYAPQKPFGSQSNYDAGTGVIDFSTVVTHANNVYEWKKDGSTVSGETTASIHTGTYGAGSYQLFVTNSDAPDLTLESVIITV